MAQERKCSRCKEPGHTRTKCPTRFDDRPAAPRLRIVPKAPPSPPPVRFPPLSRDPAKMELVRQMINNINTAERSLQFGGAMSSDETYSYFRAIGDWWEGVAVDDSEVRGNHGALYKLAVGIRESLTVGESVASLLDRECMVDFVWMIFRASAFVLDRENHHEAPVWVRMNLASILARFGEDAMAAVCRSRGL